MTTPRPEHRWRYTFCDLRTRRPLARLPLLDADLTEVIGGPADGSGRVPVTHPEVRRQDPWSATQQRRTICFAERVPVLGGIERPASCLWAGIVWKRKASGGSLALSMSTPESYFARRRAAQARTWTDEDDAVMLRQLIIDAQAVPAGSIGVLTPEALSGTLSDRTVDPADDAKLLEEVQSLAAAAPLEWRIRPGGSYETGFTLTLVIAPRLGGETARELVWTSDPGNRTGNEVIGYDVEMDGTAVPTTLRGYVAPEEDSPALASAAVSGDVDAGYPLLEDTLTGDTRGITRQDTLDRLTREELTRRRRDEVTLTGLTVAGGRGPDLTAYTLGDTLTVRARDPLWPRPTDFSGRLLARRIQPAQPGRTEAVTMTLGGT